MTEGNLTETQKVLISIPGLSSLTPDDLDALREFLRNEAYPAGGVVFTEGEHGNDMYIVKHGSVEIVKKAANEFSGTVRLARRGPGEIIGEIAVIDEEPHFATAICVEPTRLAVMSRRDFQRLLQARPELAQRVLRVLIARLKKADMGRLQDLEEKNRVLEESAAQLHRTLKELESANRQLQEALRFRQRLLDVSPDPMIVTNGELVVTYCNPAVGTVFGIDPRTSAGHDIGEVLGWCSPEDSDLMARALQQQRRWEGEAELTATDGRRMFCRIAAAPVPLDDRPTAIFLFVFRDETEIRLSQRQAAERERLACKGEMAAEIAHDLNNYLAVLSGNIELLPMFVENGNGERVDKCLKTLEASLGRMQVFSNALLSSRPPAQGKVQQDINRFLDNQVMFFKPQRKFKKIIIRASFDETIPPIEFDPRGLQQVIYNVILNAAQALVRSNNPEPIVAITTKWNAPTETVVVEIADNGPGIEAGALERLFHERFSARPDGYGIGMMTARKIVDQHGGTIAAGNQAGGGAIITIHLPASVQVLD